MASGMSPGRDAAVVGDYRLNARVGGGIGEGQEGAEGVPEERHPRFVHVGEGRGKGEGVADGAGPVAPAPPPPPASVVVAHEETHEPRPGQVLRHVVVVLFPQVRIGAVQEDDRGKSPRGARAEDVHEDLVPSGGEALARLEDGGRFGGAGLHGRVLEVGDDHRGQAESFGWGGEGVGRGVIDGFLSRGVLRFGWGASLGRLGSLLGRRGILG